MLFFILVKTSITVEAVSRIFLMLLHSEQPKLHRVLAILSAIGLSNRGKLEKSDWYTCFSVVSRMLELK